MTLTAGSTTRRPRGASRAYEHRAYSSRDYSSSAHFGRLSGSVMTAPRPTETSQSPHGRALRPSQSEVKPGRRFQRKLGSQQVVSVRGRRVESPKADRRVVRTAVLAVTVMTLGVLVAMWLSGITTKQTFDIQRLSATEAQLGNQLETLHRDVEESKAVAGVAGSAAERKMVIPSQPGVLEVHPDGMVEQKLEPNMSGNLPLIDVNQGRAKAPGASSDPNRTNEVRGRLNAVPSHNDPRPNPVDETPLAPEESSAGAPLPYSGR